MLATGTWVFLTGFIALVYMLALSGETLAPGS